MISKLRELISDVAKRNNLKVERYELDDLKLIEKHLDENDDIDGVMSKLKAMFKYHWKKDHYKQIENRLKDRK